MNNPSKHILVIDDKEKRLSSAATALREAGYRVSTARDFGAAQTVLEEQGNAFDLIIADQLQTERAKDSLSDLIWVAPDKRRRVIVLFVTEPTLSKMREVFKLGVYDCVDRQDDPDRLVEIVQKMIEKQIK